MVDDKQRIALVETRTQGSDGSPGQLVRYQFGNHLGSASLEVDDAGAVISYEEYFPYGSTSYQAVDQDIKAASKRYRYTGKERDEETGFTYHGARYCSPWLGRWISPDPSGLADGTNLFCYVHNDPVKFYDPTGRGAETKDKGFFSGIAGRLWDRANTPTAGQTAFKEGRYGDFAKDLAIDAALASNPILAQTVADIQLARATVNVPGQIVDAATTPRNDQAGVKLADALVTGAVLALRIFGPKAKGTFKAPPPEGSLPSPRAVAPAEPHPVRPPVAPAEASSPAQATAPNQPVPSFPPPPPPQPPSTPAAGPFEPGPSKGNPLPGGAVPKPQYLIKEGVRRSVAAREAGQPDVVARVIDPKTQKLGAAKPIPLEQLGVEPQKATVPRDSRYLDLFKATGRGEIKTPIEVAPLDPNKNLPVVPLSDVKLTRAR